MGQTVVVAQTVCTERAGWRKSETQRERGEDVSALCSRRELGERRSPSGLLRRPRPELGCRERTWYLVVPRRAPYTLHLGPVKKYIPAERRGERRRVIGANERHYFDNGVGDGGARPPSTRPPSPLSPHGTCECVCDRWVDMKAPFRPLCLSLPFDMFPHHPAPSLFPGEREECTGRIIIH